MNSSKIRITADEASVRAVGYILIFLFGMCCIIPFWLVVASSFADEQSIIRNGYMLWPSELSLDAYKWVLRNPQRILTAYASTALITVVGTCISVVFTVMTGYVLSRRDFPWANQFSLFFFFTTLFSGGLVPWYIWCTKYLMLKDSYLGRILPLLFSVWNIIIAKNYMKSISYEITESAKIDGATDLVIFVRLIFPLAKPLVATLALFSALGFWNDWYYSMLFIRTESKQSLQYFLQDMLSSAKALKQLAAQGQVQAVSIADLPTETMKMAMTCVVTGPIIFLYPLLQRHFVKGLTIGAVKG